ncbi:Nuclear transcription factor Y subunit C-9 [Porphyridium purpureum]|uniref:Nuclear transcription factor Y subunit C-9 n=1 Tax=Porphyridium purpureum TaxID=35688 RepID=A0A5J4YT50_PORPP|nr:Nuclear transcription factor Y subunit C-9 [Porphyridium purpureum]|eukprot:POR6700..scf229_5
MADEYVGGSGYGGDAGEDGDDAAHQLHMQQSMQNLEIELKKFWDQQRDEAALVTDVKNHTLPLARIKKIMKSDEDVRMISAEAPVLFAKACEMFIVELTLRAWAQTEEAKRRTLQRSDIALAIQKTDIFDFLIDIVPREDAAGTVKKEESARLSTGAAGDANAHNVQYYSMQQHAGMPSHMPAGSLYDPQFAAMYQQQQQVPTHAQGAVWTTPAGAYGSNPAAGYATQHSQPQHHQQQQQQQQQQFQQGGTVPSTYAQQSRMQANPYHPPPPQ